MAEPSAERVTPKLPSSDVRLPGHTVSVTTTLTRGDGPRPPARPSKRRKRKLTPLTAIGLVLLIAGLASLGWVGYQYFGTNVISEKAFDEERSELRQQWEDPATKKADVSDQKRDKLEDGTSFVPGEAIALLRIPAFGAEYEIPILEGVDLDLLDRGVGHYPTTAMPGQIGNFAIAGHRVTHGQPFSRLLDLDKGDEVVVETRDAIYTYVIDQPARGLTVSDKDTWVIDPVPGKTDVAPTQALMTLTTCQDLFRSADRSIAFAHLDTTQNKS